MRLVVGVDGRQGGDDAIALARALSAPNALLTYVHVYGGNSAGGRASATAIPFELQTAEELLAGEAGRASGPVNTMTVCDSSVARGLHSAAARCHADVLVIGACHRGALGRAVFGSDAAATAYHAPCAVAIAPPGYASELGSASEWGRVRARLSRAQRA